MKFINTGVFQISVEKRKCMSISRTNVDNPSRFLDGRPISYFLNNHFRSEIASVTNRNPARLLQFYHREKRAFSVFQFKKVL